MHGKEPKKVSPVVVALLLLLHPNNAAVDVIANDVAITMAGERLADVVTTQGLQAGHGEKQPITEVRTGHNQSRDFR